MLCDAFSVCSFQGGFCQSAALHRSRSGLPVQHAVCVSPVGADLPAGQDAGGVLRWPPAGGDGPGGPSRPRAQYPQTALAGFEQLGRARRPLLEKV